MAKAQKAIITCAVTGAIHTPSMSRYLPVSAEEIADAAIGAAEAGAAIVHIHARNPEDGRPDQRPEAFAPILKVVKQRADCVINITTGGAPWMRVEERVLPAASFAPEIASLNMGSMNFGLFPMLNRFKEFEHEWERQHLENSRDLIFRNTYKDIEYVLRTCAENGTRFEFECYDIGHLYNLAHFLERGLVSPPLFVQSVFGILGGIGPHPEDVQHMKRTADRLFGDAYRWSVWAPAATRCRSPPWPRRWAATSASGSRTACGSGPASWPRAAPPRSARCARSWPGSASRPPPRRRRARCWRSRAATGWASEGAMLRIELLIDAGDQLGEGPLWDVDEQRLYWVDSYGKTVQRSDARGAERRSWPVPEHIGSMCLRERGGAVVALRNGFHFLDLESGAVTPIADPEPDRPRTRLNDGKVDRQGRFVAGAMDYEERDGICGLYRLDPDLSITRLDDGIIVSNGPCWSPDGRTLYFADSFRRVIYAYDYLPASGAVGGRRIFAFFEPCAAIPMAPRSTRRASCGAPRCSAAG